MCSRLESATNVITVCDREADIYDYLVYLLDHGHRFVIRAAQDRCLATSKGHLFDVIAKLPAIGKRMVSISQRGAQRGTAKQKQRASRSARTSCMLVRAATIELARPANRHVGPETMRISVVYLRERHPPKGEEPAEWILLTTESIASHQQVERVIGYYECRWLIEMSHSYCCPCHSDLCARYPLGRAPAQFRGRAQGAQAGQLRGIRANGPGPSNMFCRLSPVHPAAA
jgi:hypothetical protein